MGYSPWGRKESDMTDRLNNNNKQALPTNILLFVSINLSMQGTSYKWKHKISVLL